MKVKIIAEAGVNHNGSLDIAIALIDVAVKSGADIVKFQTFKAAKLVQRSAPKARYQIENCGEESQFDLLRRLELSETDHFKLLNYCKKKGITFLSSPFDHESLSFLSDKLGLKTIKLGSGEITNGPLLMEVARRGLSIILSTGMSSNGEIELALGCLAFGYLHLKGRPSREAFLNALFSDDAINVLRKKVTLLHCTTEYPASFEDVNLKSMVAMKNTFGINIGYSDHTKGISVPLAATALGATIIEKHFTLDKNLPGPDHKASLDPDELIQMVRGVREIECSLGSEVKKVCNVEWENRRIVRKSLRSSRYIEEGKILEEIDIICTRPGNGRSPMDYWDFLGNKTTKKYNCGDLI